MFLKRLVLNGFKSFSDHSEITFVKGISAIVGPNGCGKSNIVDALKWVIGEQKTKMLRANNMVDVIFKGTENKKGLGRAEVKLILVNEQNILPIDFNEVEIARVIFASGENEYYINKKRVRLKDIHELFFDTGVGKSAYSVMEQGKIDLILSNKPEDRRYIIEEAAGITKYKVKKEEALSRLKQSNENIIRIKDIIEEVKSQYNHMKKQAEKAEKFKNLHDKEIKLEIELNLNRIIKHKGTRNELEKKIEKSINDLEEVKKQLDNLEDGVEEQLNRLTEFENKKIENQREVFNLLSDIKIFNSKIDILRDQMQQYEINIKNDSERIKAFDNNIKEINDELINIKNNKKEFDDKIVSITKDNKFYKDNILKINSEISITKNVIKELKDEIINSNNELEKKRTEQKNITDQLIVRIDQSPDIFDVNAEEITNFKTDLKDKISYILSNLPKKRIFIDDIIRGGYVSKESAELLKALGSLRDDLIIIEQNVTDIDENIKKYIQTTEIFLNDIFGPDGFVQQKRMCEHTINELVDKINNNSSTIDMKQQEIIKKRDKKEEFDKVLHELNLNLTTINEKKNSIDNDIKRLLSMKAHHENNKDELVQKISFSRKKIDEISKNINDTEIKLKELKSKKQSLENGLIEIDKKIRHQNTTMSAQQKNIKDINNKWMNKKNEVEKINIKIAESKTTITNLYDNFYENFSIDLVEYESKKGYSSNRSYEEIRKILGEVKADKHSLGNVNLMAIEESKALKERYNLLTEQLEDLQNAKKDIHEMMEKISSVSEEMFLKTFKQIKTNFHKIFRKLFDGGNAEISLTNPDNILESGIEILAHPPGQKTQGIALLSGGQRTMTAIALMFATFLVKPSPFCILDEIDAALDEENVRRFINLLHESKETSQFIIITHNSKTISASDVMYGVTQEEKGISKIVSAKFAQKVS